MSSSTALCRIFWPVALNEHAQTFCTTRRSGYLVGWNVRGLVCCVATVVFTGAAAPPSTSMTVFNNASSSSSSSSSSDNNNSNNKPISNTATLQHSSQHATAPGISNHAKKDVGRGVAAATTPKLEENGTPLRTTTSKNQTAAATQQQQHHHRHQQNSPPITTYATLEDIERVLASPAIRNDPALARLWERTGGTPVVLGQWICEGAPASANAGAGASGGSSGNAHTAKTEVAATGGAAAAAAANGRGMVATTRTQRLDGSTDDKHTGNDAPCNPAETSPPSLIPVGGRRSANENPRHNGCGYDATHAKEAAAADPSPAVAFLQAEEEAVARSKRTANFWITLKQHPQAHVPVLLDLYCCGYRYQTASHIVLYRTLAGAGYYSHVPFSFRGMQELGISSVGDIDDVLVQTVMRKNGRGSTEFLGGVGSAGDLSSTTNNSTTEDSSDNNLGSGTGGSDDNSDGDTTAEEDGDADNVMSPMSAIDEDREMQRSPRRVGESPTHGSRHIFMSRHLSSADMYDANENYSVRGKHRSSADAVDRRKRMHRRVHSGALSDLDFGQLSIDASAVAAAAAPRHTLERRDDNLQYTLRQINNAARVERALLQLNCDGKMLLTPHRLLNGEEKGGQVVSADGRHDGITFQVPADSRTSNWRESCGAIVKFPILVLCYSLYVVGSFLLYCMNYSFALLARSLRSHAMVGAQIDRRVRALMGLPYTLLRRRRPWLDKHEANFLFIQYYGLLTRVVVDIAAGTLVWYVLRTFPDVILDYVHRGLKILESDVLRAQVEWLMGMPADIKLNAELNHRLGSLVLEGLDVWDLYKPFVGPVQRHIVAALSLVGVVGGASLVCAILSDLLFLATIHIDIVHTVFSRLYGMMLKVLGVLWRLFRGKKRNVLRLRIDNCHYDMEQLVAALWWAIAFFNYFPFFGIFLFIFSRGRLPGGVRFDVLRLREAEDTHGNVEHAQDVDTASDSASVMPKSAASTMSRTLSSGKYGAAAQAENISTTGAILHTTMAGSSNADTHCHVVGTDTGGGGSGSKNDTAPSTYLLIHNCDLAFSALFVQYRLVLRSILQEYSPSTIVSTLALGKRFTREIKDAVDRPKEKKKRHGVSTARARMNSLRGSRKTAEVSLGAWELIAEALNYG